jgi:hypothetical protein
LNTNPAEIKNHLHKLVVETDDEVILNKVQAYFTTLKNQNNDWWDTLSEPEIATINIGLQQLKNGEGISQKEVNQKVAVLLGR